MLTMPEHLSPEMAAIWVELIDEMQPRIGRAGMEAYCSQVALSRDARQRIESEGAVVADARGNPVEHPSIAIARTAQGEIRTWIAKYGK